MKKILVLMSILISLIASSDSTLKRYNFVDDFTFHYISSDGSVYLNCTSKVLPSEPDFYRVTCGQAPGVVKVFDARFRVRQLNMGPRPAFELVYWVTDRNTPERFDYGSTTWLYLDQGDILRLTTHMDVENAYAALILRYTRFIVD